MDKQALRARIGEIYPEADTDACMRRYMAAITRFNEIFGQGEQMLLSVPGRTEIGGNHTDHNHGRVLAGSVNLDVIAVVSATNDGMARVHSEGFPPDEVKVSDTQVYPNEEGTSAALIRGIIAGAREMGFNAGGFCAYTISDVLQGSGLSSSAAFEVLVCNIINQLYNDGRISPTRMAMIGQYAENAYFKKPCGLMDQIACATGGFVAIDFRESGKPLVTPIPFDFSSAGHTLCIVDIKAGHEELTDAYAAIPAEMKRVANAFDKEVLREVDPRDFYANFARVREKCSDRALLRAIHFFDEDERADLEAKALLAGDFARFLELVNESGRSSYMYLQNIYVEGGHMPVAIGLALSQRLLRGRGAYRVHGGGFAGTIQAIVPNDMLESYKEGIEAVFGKGSCYPLMIRKHGALRVL